MENIRRKVLNYFGRIRNSQKLEKRLFLLMALLVLFAIFSQEAAKSAGGLNSPISLESNNLEFERAKAKVAGEANWRPIGWGSGEYLEDIPVISAGAVINLDSAEVIWSMNLDKKVAPASLSKVATVMTALDLAEEGKQITVDEAAAGQIPTKLGLSAGEKLDIEEAAAAAILTSANDATEAIANSLGSDLGGNNSTFMELVNIKLESIGAVNSKFSTATGLDDESHYSTVRDLAIIGQEAKANYPVISRLAALRQDRLVANGDHKVFDLPNWNALLGTYPGVDGLKIGYTEAAGHSTMVTAERYGVRLISIVIGADSIENREIAAATLLNYGFKKNDVEVYPLGEINLVGRFEEWRKQLSEGRGG